MRNIALIGYGAIGAAVVDAWPTLADRARLATLLVRPYQLDAARAAVPSGTLVTDDRETFLATDADLVVEAAGHDAVIALGEAVLASGRDFHILSVGALADPALHEHLRTVAEANRARIIILPGALAGFDGLISLRAGLISHVRYISVKPYEAWIGTPAEAQLPLSGDHGIRTVFRGSATDVCRAFPKNANLAAAVAIAGIGFDRTEVELVADPGITLNSGRLIASGDAGEIDVTMVGAGFDANPKSSRITALSVIATLYEMGEPIAFR